MARIALLLALLCAVSPAEAGRRVTAVEMVDPLTFRTLEGEVVRLAGLHVPAAEERRARAVLEAALRDRPVVELIPLVPERDRYGRTLAEVVGDGGGSLQALLVARGLGLVQPAPGGDRSFADLLRLEREAARQRRGLWGRADAVAAAADQAARLVGRYGIVHGRILDVGQTDHHIYLNFAADWRHDFTLKVRRPELDHVVGRWAADVEELAGRRVRARGFVVDAGGPMIELAHPEQIEVLP